MGCCLLWLWLWLRHTAITLGDGVFVDAGITGMQEKLAAHP